MKLSRLVAGAAGAVLLGGAAAAQTLELPPNDYPTSARADYVFACMQVNGQSREILVKCSCSIDQVAAVLPWEEYEEAATIKSLEMRGGENVAWTHNPTQKTKIDNLRRAQVEGELRCF